jgi:hypothetical protein
MPRPAKVVLLFAHSLLELLAYHPLHPEAPVSLFTASREMGDGGDSLVRRIYGHLATFANERRWWSTGWSGTPWHLAGGPSRAGHYWDRDVG